MNIIQKCANNFKSLLHTNYIIVLGKKGKTTELLLYFDEDSFYHLIGLHYIKDVPQLKADRTTVFNAITNSDLSTKILKSKNYNEISSRVDAFEKFSYYLESDNTIFKYNKLAPSAKYSKIDFNFLIVSKEHNNKFFTFLRKDGTDSFSVVPVSFFPLEKNDYSIGQVIMTVLYKEKINTITGESNVIYCHKNYIPET